MNRRCREAALGISGLHREGIECAVAVGGRRPIEVLAAIHQGIRAAVPGRCRGQSAANAQTPRAEGCHVEPRDGAIDIGLVGLGGQLGKGDLHGGVLSHRVDHCSHHAQGRIVIDSQQGDCGGRRACLWTIVGPFDVAVSDAEADRARRRQAGRVVVRAVGKGDGPQHRLVVGHALGATDCEGAGVGVVVACHPARRTGGWQLERVTTAQASADAYGC